MYDRNYIEQKNLTSAVRFHRNDNHCVYMHLRYRLFLPIIAGTCHWDRFSPSVWSNSQIQYSFALKLAQRNRGN